jgi:hypothetical protein
MARRKITHPRIGRGSVGRGSLPAQYGAGAKITAPTLRRTGHYPGVVEQNRSGRYPTNVRRTGRYPN